jgi:hypothetical protein
VGANDRTGPVASEMSNVFVRWWRFSLVASVWYVGWNVGFPRPTFNRVLVRIGDPTPHAQCVGTTP